MSGQTFVTETKCIVLLLTIVFILCYTYLGNIKTLTKSKCIK